MNTNYELTAESIQPDITTYELALLCVMGFNRPSNISEMLKKHPELKRHLIVEDVKPSGFDKLFTRLMSPLD